MAGDDLKDVKGGRISSLFLTDDTAETSRQLRNSPLSAAAVTAGGQFCSSRFPTAAACRSSKTSASPSGGSVGGIAALLVGVGDSSLSLPEPTTLLDSSF